ncbi:ABC transporter permease subunit [Georgenia subflava]|uniref:ABC transporter permease subunit n=2 Tax=Georgenia subflava TaxID=1622177 RepID=A0A6N7EL33_9MICO|nr:ABC transporter permease subunit [Georgenia subflava]
MPETTPAPLPPAAPRPRNRRRNTRPKLSGDGPVRRIGITLIWGLVGFNVLLLLWVVLQSLRGTREIFDNPWGLPTSLRFENFVDAWTASNFGTAALNSLNVTIVSSVLTVAIAAPAAYYLSRQESRLTNVLTMYFILGLGVPVQVILLPLFVMMSRLYLTDSLIGLNLVYIGTSMPFTVFLLTAFFRSLPSELEEAAALDGTSPFQTFWRIMLPLAKGGLLTAFVLQVISHWNETLLALTLLQSTDKFTLPVALISFVQQQTYSGADWGGLFAGLCIVILPMVVVFVWLGRRLTEGLTLGMGK